MNFTGINGMGIHAGFRHSILHAEFLRVKEFVYQRLLNELKPTLYYHNAQHTLDVCRSVETLAIMERVNEGEKIMLLTAALFHDTGFLWAYENNEPFACEFAAKTLPEFGYNPLEVSTVCQLILSTTMPQRPENLLEEIICDADLDYIGREDFFLTALRLHREWSEYNDRKIPFKAWYQKQRDFVEMHEFFTRSARLLRNEKKRKNLSQVRELLNLIESSDEARIKNPNNKRN